ncbi:glycerophosphodiester phosphodiesterase family protein [Oceanicella actignis]|uniref:Glycerophosphoryl diester phosphodiesterase n=1 Tax=Oceanicella actignis TaxID=1189325 RepID=A0A1M7RRG4_9RHOB|nr:glycerophosphodiester phosphodiesterase family protein [Oceanicella actignis]SET07035.1 Glycerophosphoryl diester phosphodiesterase [Oceanicella actignis]SHN48854.1 Glycerophosphoryl diester phosphodiesterase [Oceanicella actignis]
MTRLHPDFRGMPIAHRGLHDLNDPARAPENSRAAARAACAAGYGVETDVQISSDGEAMVFHDDCLDRLVPGHAGPVRARSAAELGRMTLMGGTETIPTLAELMELVDTPLLIEIKRQHIDVGVGPLERRVAELLPRARGPVAVMSFDPRVIAWFRDNAPQWARGLVSYGYGNAEALASLSEEERGRLSRLEDFDALGADFVSFGARDFPSPACAALRARGVPVLCWTTRSQEEDDRAREHADNVTFEGYAARRPAPAARPGA